MDNLNEKSKALIKFLFREDIKFEIKDKKIIIEVEKPLVEFVELVQGQIQGNVDLELEVKESKQEKKRKMIEISKE